MPESGKETVRSRVFDAVCRYPGIHVRGLERELDVSAPLVQYHLKRLVEAGYVEPREGGGYVRYYATKRARSVRVEPEDEPLVSILRESVPLHVALILLDHGPQTHSEIVDRTGLAKSTVSYQLAKMAEAGVLERVPGEARLRLVDRDRVYNLLLTFRPTQDLIDTFADLWEDLYD